MLMGNSIDIDCMLFQLVSVEESDLFWQESMYGSFCQKIRNAKKGLGFRPIWNEIANISLHFNDSL